MFGNLKKNYLLLKNSLLGIVLITLSIIGILSSIITVLSGVTGYKGYSIKGLILLFIIAAVIAILIILKRLESIKIKVSDKVTVSIKIGDIFKSKGIIVIPVDEYFYTTVDENRISSSTLHGMFINIVYKSNTEKLRRELEEKLKGKKFKIGFNDEKKYPIGTSVTIEEKGQVYILVALSKFREEEGTYKAFLKNTEEYKEVIESLLNYIHLKSQGNKVSIPLIGAGQSGIDLTEQDILENLINSFRMKKSIVASGGIEIVIYNDDLDKINFERVRVLQK